MFDTVLDIESYPFYGGEVSLFFDPEDHVYYRIEGNEKILIPGVTSIIDALDKPALVPWAANQTTEYIRRNWESAEYDTLDALLEAARRHFRDIQAEAADIGSLAHDWLDKHLKQQLGVGPQYNTRPDHVKANNAIDAALDWMQKHQFKVVYCERKVYSKQYNYAGTMDLYGAFIGCGDEKCCEFSGLAHAIGDFKTSKRIYDQYRLQTTAYQQALLEEFPDLVVDKRLILRIDKEGDGFEAKVLHQEDWDADFRGFMGALDVYQWQRELVYSRAIARKVKRMAKLKALAAEKAEKAAAKAAKAAAKAAEVEEKAKALAAKREAAAQKKLLAVPIRKPRKVLIEVIEEIPMEDAA